MELATPEQTLVGVKTVKRGKIHSYKIGWNSGYRYSRPCA